MANEDLVENDEWEAESVIQFLKQIVKEAEKHKDSGDAEAVESFNRNELRLVSDNRLPYLFRNKYIIRIKIHQLLAPEEEDSNEEETAMTRKRKAVEEAPPPPPEICFADIKLVYFKRSLVEELLMDAATFESKLVGSYVRIKYDSNDCLRGNSHQLLQLTGVRKSPECGDDDAEYFLQVQHLIKEIPVSMLSNEDFTMEECEDLLQRIKAGSANRPTVMELQQKAQILHKVITKQEAIEDIHVQPFQTGDSAESYPIYEAKLDYEVFQGHKNSRIHDASSSENIFYESDNIVNSGSSHYNFVARSSQYDNVDHRCYNVFHHHIDAEIKEMKERMKAMQDMMDRLLVRKTN